MLCLGKLAEDGKELFFPPRVSIGVMNIGYWCCIGVVLVIIVHYQVYLFVTHTHTLSMGAVSTGIAESWAPRNSFAQ